MVLIMLIDRNVFSNKSFAKEHGELLMISYRIFSMYQKIQRLYI